MKTDLKSKNTSIGNDSVSKAMQWSPLDDILKKKLKEKARPASSDSSSSQEQVKRVKSSKIRPVEPAFDYSSAKKMIDALSNFTQKIPTLKTLEPKCKTSILNR